MAVFVVHDLEGRGTTSPSTVGTSCCDTMASSTMDKLHADLAPAARRGRRR